MDIYSFQTAHKIVAGRHSLNELHKQLDGFPSAQSAYILTSKFIKDLGFLDVITKQLEQAGIRSDWNMDVDIEPSADNIRHVFDHFKRGTYDLIIGIGGGSVLDAAKVLSVMPTNPMSVEEMIKPNRISNPGLPTILIPTTAGTGSEVTPNAIVTFPEQELKIGIVSRYLLPDLVILDPVLTVSMPKLVTASTGMDALTHALESYISNKANPLSDMFALESMRLISKHIVAAYERPEDLDAREGMLIGSAYGGMALTSAGTAAVHAMAYPLGGKYNIPHGIANSMLLSHVMRFNLDAIERKLANVARAMNLSAHTNLQNEQQDAQLVIKQIEEWTAILDIPQDLSSFNVQKEDVHELSIAASQVTRLMNNNPKQMAVSDIEKVYLQLL